MNQQPSSSPAQPQHLRPVVFELLALAREAECSGELDALPCRGRHLQAFLDACRRHRPLVIDAKFYRPEEYVHGLIGRFEFQGVLNLLVVNLPWLDGDPEEQAREIRHWFDSALDLLVVMEYAYELLDTVGPPIVCRPYQSARRQDV